MDNIDERGVKLPNFLIVGAAKSGTTSLYHYLNQHPDIYIHPRKEAKFLSQMGDEGFNGPGDEMVKMSVTNTFEQYTQLFQDVTDEFAVGDVSPEYLYYYENTIRNIKKYLGDDVKIIIILRNPADKVWSQYFHLVRGGRESLGFEEALGQEQNRIREGWEWTWHYTRSSCYFDQVKAFKNEFGDNVFIRLHDDLQSDPLFLVKDIFRFLGVDKAFTPDVSRIWNTTKPYQKNGLLRFLRSNKSLFITQVRKSVVAILGKERTERLVNYALNNKYISDLNIKKADYNEKTRKELTVFFRDDIIKLQNLLERDLTGWFNS